MLRGSKLFSRNYLINARCSQLRGRNLGTLVATEEFAYNTQLDPKKAVAAVVTSSKTESGISLISREFNSSSVSLQFAVLGGSSVETTSQKGAAHFLASAAYAGTNTSTGLKMVRALESVGAKFEAYADKEKIVYDVKVLPDAVEPVVQCVMQLIGSAPYAHYVLEESKSTAQLTYNSFATNYSAQLYELLNEAAYGETSPLGSSQYSTSLKKLPISSVLEYRAKTFIRSNVIVAANGISHDRLKQLVDANAEYIPGGAPLEVPSSPYLGGEVKVRTDIDGVAHLALGFPVPAGEAGKPFAVLKALLDTKLATKKVCAVPVLISYSSGGLLAIHTSGPPSQAAEYLADAVNELKAIASGASADIDILKQKVSLDNFLALEGSNSTAVLVDAKLRNVAPEVMADARSVSSKSVSAAAVSALGSIPAFAVLGATAGSPSFTTVCSWLK